MKIDDFGDMIELHFCTEMDFFEEVAKYRAGAQSLDGVGTDTLRRHYAEGPALPLTRRNTRAGR